MSDTPRDFSRELYPFLYESGQRAETSLVALFAEVRRSTLDKCADVVALRHRMLDEYETQLSVAATAMAERFSRGGKLVAFGNGGSATDADDAAADCLTPPHAQWSALPAISLPADGATGSAVANDVGVEHVFVRQIVALGDRRDIALGISTSGRAANVVAGLAEAKRRGMLTIAFTGYDGGAIARDNNTDFCFVARHEFVPRIQEGHATVWHCLLALVQDALAHRAEAVP